MCKIWVDMNSRDCVASFWREFWVDVRSGKAGPPTISEFIFQPLSPIPISTHIQTNNNVCNSKFSNIKTSNMPNFTSIHQSALVTSGGCSYAQLTFPPCRLSFDFRCPNLSNLITLRACVSSPLKPAYPSVSCFRRSTARVTHSTSDTSHNKMTEVASILLQ